MIVLDTNVVSEPMRVNADLAVAAWLERHGFSMATRDAAPFVAAGVPVVNPCQG